MKKKTEMQMHYFLFFNKIIKKFYLETKNNYNDVIIIFIIIDQ